MRLKRLKLSGFKSFCDDTVFEFQNKGITMVVGPNGCGKSNVVDAIRWVLGEQAPRYLRGQVMSDVIFNGSDSRKPLGRTEVTIQFDNEDGGSPEKYRDLSEISVTRRLYRSGESEYLINKIPCRLLDIRELVMDTGVAGRSYSIVEQGRVEEFVTASPAERRIYMEEAAGIVLYKTRRIAAERKLEQTHQNLLRVEDLQGELNRQEGQLRDQKTKAQEYLKLREQVSALVAQLARARYVAGAARCKEMEQRAVAMRSETTLLEHALSTVQARLEQLNLEQAQRETRLKERREAVRAHEAEIGEMNTRRAVERQNRENGEEWIGRINGDLEEIRGRKAALAEEFGGARQSLQTLREQQQAAETEILRLESEHAGQEAARDTLEAANTETREQLVECHTRLSGIAAQQQFLQQRLAEGEQRRAGLENQIASSTREHEAATQRLAEVRNSAAGLHREMELREERALELGREISAKAREFEENQAAQAHVDREALECRSRLASLREIEAGREGFDQTVKAALEWAEESPEARESLGWLGPLADFIKVPGDVLAWAGDYLAPALEWIVIREQARLPLAQETLAAQGLGGVRVVALDAFEGTPPAGAPSLGDTLAELVELPPEFEGLRRSLFGAVRIHEGGLLPSPLPARGPSPAGDAWIEWLAADGGFHVDHRGVVTLGRSGAPAAGILRRRAEISAIEAGLEDLEARQATVRAEVGRLEAEAEGLQTRLQEEETLRTEQTLAASRQEQEQEHAERETGRLAQVSDGLRGGREELERDAERFLAEQGAMVEDCSQTQERQKELEADFAEGQTRGQRAAAALASLNSQLTDKKVAQGQTGSRVEHAANRIAAMETEDAELGRKLTDAERNLAAYGERVETSGRTLTELDEALSAREKELAHQVRELLESTSRYDGEERERQQLARKTEEEQRRVSQGRNRLHEVEMELTREVAHMEQWVEQMGGVLPEEISAPEELPAEYGAEGGTEERLDEKTLEQNLEKTLAVAQKRMEGMEGVNLAAPEEYDSIATRLDFILNQKEDLEAAIADLENSIRRMNQESRRRFKETFDQVNEKFKEIFPKIFNGGSAELVLTDAEDLLLAGVEIVAQPPGKKLQNLNLLSGGEKALTAIALIFSFFLFKPSPFCLLDEVDAPLDDINVGRFARMIQSMTDRSQFIIITHNKRTMEVGDTLYGVTMEEPGVSKIVSVNLA